MNPRTISRTIDAEARAVEEGHRARLGDAAIVVKSDTTDGLDWHVTAAAPFHMNAAIQFTCAPSRLVDNGHHELRGEPGALPCKHAGVAVRRLEREGLARFDAQWGWISTAKAMQISETIIAMDAARARAMQNPTDPFAGLPS
jgi:hypothetical protein